MPGTFTFEARQRGGWTRAKQKAMERKDRPSPAEGRVRSILTEMGYKIEVEVEIFTVFPQWIDIVIDAGETFIAIEVDGSHSWHNSLSSKMKHYDEEKAKWCRENNIPLLVIQNFSEKYVRGKLTDGIQKALEEWRNAQSQKSGGTDCRISIQQGRLVYSQVR